MFGAHGVELVFILIIALIVFGPGKLPEVANTLGKGIREFRRATSELEDAVLHHSEPEVYSPPSYTTYDDESDESYGVEAHEDVEIEGHSRA